MFLYRVLFIRDSILYYYFHIFSISTKLNYGENFYVNSSMHFSCRENKICASSRRRARQRGTDGQKNYADTSAMGGDRLINDLTKAGNN